MLLEPLEDRRLLSSIDWGDAPDAPGGDITGNPYPTLAEHNGANHTIEAGFYMGYGVDADPDGQPDMYALGDDLDGSSDESGGVFPNLFPGAPFSTVTVNVTDTAGGAKYINGWIDLNNDGDWTDAGEHIVTDYAALGDADGENNNISAPIPVSTPVGYYYARFRLSRTTGLTPSGSASSGEVEDLLVFIKDVDSRTDFGDAPGDATHHYPTYTGGIGAVHGYSPSLYLGTYVDGELDGQPNVTATGDDINLYAGDPVPPAPDDEDGVTPPVAIVAGQPAAFSVFVTGTGGKLDAWIDYNQDGDWDDAGEQAVTSQPMSPGANPVNISIPASAVPGTTFARFRLSSAGNLAVRGYAVDGEVEDYQIEIEPGGESELDWGDAPDGPYPTLSASNGASHVITIGPVLGAVVDADPDGQPNSTATGDDTDADGDDEDGVTFPAPVRVGQLGAAVTVTVTNGPAKLDAWIDFNGDGSWGGPGEQIFDSTTVFSGVNNLTFDVPRFALAGSTYARFRLSTAGNRAPSGTAADGEVEDYQVTIANPVSSTGTFNSQTTISTGVNFATSVFAADVDQDGDMDVLSASISDNRVAWYKNDGSQNFTQYTISTAANGASSVFAADVDADGDVDVLSASFNDNKIAWYQNDGTQNFTAHTISTAASGAFSVFAADVDSDGDLDVLSASYNDNKIAWYENDGNQNFTAHTISTAALAAFKVFAADVDSDGDMDVLSASANDNKIAWYKNDGHQNFTLQTISTTASGARSVFAADVDSDGDTDVLSASYNNDTIAWYQNDGSENFTAHNITTSADGAWDVFAADMNGDGDVDVIGGWSGPSSWGLALYENDGSENFTAHTISINTADVYGVRSVFAADVDRDGDLDILTAQSLGNRVGWYENLTPEQDLDWGDAPDNPGAPTTGNPYPTLAEHNGANHVIDPNFYLGATIDAETDGQPNATATGDDDNPLAGPDDEDGAVLVGGVLVPGTVATYQVTVHDPTGINGFLDAWIDNDMDGSFTSYPEEHFLVSQPVVDGVNTFHTPISILTLPGTRYVRFRLSSTGLANPDGPAPDGEVEDYAVDVVVPDNIKWLQEPDFSTAGMDIRVDNNDPTITLADDFLCTEMSLLTDVHFWGSWFNDFGEPGPKGEIANIHLSIHSDDPVGPGGSDPSNTFSKPDQLLWQLDFAPGEFVEQLLGVAEQGEGWYDPATQQYIFPGDALIWEYNIQIDRNDAFLQTGTFEEPVVYWLDIHADIDDQTPGTFFGWKTRYWDDHFNDDAVYSVAAGPWNELRYPAGHVLEGQSVDMAFALTFEPTEVELDWGDAPDNPGTPGTGNPYPTLAEHDGARHAIVIGGPTLGPTIDTEPDGQPNGTATGDDLAGAIPDDEDGVTFPVTGYLASGLSTKTGNVTVDLQNANTTSNLLDAWIDFNQNGDWTDPGEQIFTSYSLGTTSGLKNLTFTIPQDTGANVITGTTFARFRLSTTGGLAPNGFASDGEVEDYTVTICSTHVSNTNDSGDGSLRQAITCANTVPGIDTVTFGIAGAGVHTIGPLTALPVVAETVVIDGTSQPGFGGTPVIEIDGSGTTAPANGLHLQGAGSSGSTIRGLAINGFNATGFTLSSAAIRVDNGSGLNTISGNYLGLDADGVTAAGNLFGLHISTADNLIEDNVISANNRGILLNAGGATGNTVRHNLIGTNAGGNASLGNVTDGVKIRGGSDNVIGGPTDTDGNVISANFTGVAIYGGSANNNTVQHNLIGTKSTGDGNRGNYVGINLIGTPGNTIKQNVVAGSKRQAVRLIKPATTGTLVENNLIGLDLSGTLAIATKYDGIQIANAPANTIRGNVIANSGFNGIRLLNALSTGNMVQGNKIGTALDGTTPMGNSLAGIMIKDAPANIIGGTVPGQGNLISANAKHGIFIERASAAGNVIEGNYIGTDVSGTTALGNASHGIQVDDGAGNIIGGAAPGAGNVIAGNLGAGIAVTGGSATIQGNAIGTDATGTLVLGNTNDGINVNGGTATIGGAGAGNVIANNGNNGVKINSGTGNAILGNSIHDNAAMGIDLKPPNGPTVNDYDTGSGDDADTGANNLQNYPEITSAVLNGANLNITYSIPTTTVCSAFPLTVEFFLADTSGAEGQTYLGSHSYTTQGLSPTATISKGSAGIGSVIVATATDAGGNTSEFSAAAVVSAGSLPAGGEVAQESSVESQEPDQSQLMPVVDAAIDRSSEADFEANLFANVQYAVADLPGAVLGLAAGELITGDNAADYGWFAGGGQRAETREPNDASFVNRKLQIANQKSIELFTAVMHELGDEIGLPDLYDSDAEDDPMFGWLAAEVSKTAFEASLADAAFDDF